MHVVYMYHRHMARSVQVRNVPDSVHRALRSRAAAAGVSLSDYLLHELVRIAERPPIADVLGRVGSRRGGASPDAIVTAVRSGPERQA